MYCISFARTRAWTHAWTHTWTLEKRVEKQSLNRVDLFLILAAKP